MKLPSLVCFLISVSLTVTNFVVAPLSFLSGTFYSVNQLAPEWRWMIDCNPIFYLIDGLRYGMTGYHDGNVETGLWIVGLVTFLLWVLCHQAWSRGYGVKF